MMWDNRIIGPYNGRDTEDVVNFRRAVEEAGRKGYELVGISNAGNMLYAAVKRLDDESLRARPRNRVQEN